MQKSKSANNLPLVGETEVTLNVTPLLHWNEHSATLGGYLQLVGETEVTLSVTPLLHWNEQSTVHLVGTYN